MTAAAVIASRRSWRIATALAFAAAACGMLLGGMSAWFLGSVALAGLSASAATFHFHTPAALIRLFAVGRTGARYGQRLVGHRAALIDQVARRVSLFASLAASQSVHRAGWQLGDRSRLADYLDDVEDLDFARLRASLPSLTLACAMIALFTLPRSSAIRARADCRIAPGDPAPSVASGTASRDQLGTGPNGTT